MPESGSIPAAVRRSAAEAVARIERRLLEGAPALATPTVAWMRALAGDVRPERYFLHPAAFPMLLLPWWMEASFRSRPSRSFQRDVAYSTICGYYAVRMIDDLMDRDAEPEPRILPSITVLHAEFERTYHAWFEADDPFWDMLLVATYAGAETASRDAGLQRIDRAAFIETCARKVAGARVPLAAVACRERRLGAFAAWTELVDRFGRWHQMLNDVAGWDRDLARGRPTYLLSEAARRSPDAPAAWIIREGLAWAYAELDGWMDEALEVARGLGSPDLTAYLERRRDVVAREWERTTATLRLLQPGA